MSAFRSQAFMAKLRAAAPNLSRELLASQQCGRNYTQKHNVLRQWINVSSKGAAYDKTSFRAAFKSTRRTQSTIALNGATAASTATGQSATRARFFPEASSKAVGYWLLASAGSVFGIVVFGGLTRLTESGLSITEWKPVTGSKPPLTSEDWELEFAKYQASPEFKKLNPHMNLEEFKKIYYMEWIHRLWGRFVGLSFVIPAVYFVARRKVSARMSLRLAGIAGLIGFQGFLGWWMVKSGLKDDLFAPNATPRVSQYRLTAHLGAAFVCYIAMLWNGLTILQANRLLASTPSQSKSALSALSKPSLNSFKRSILALFVLTFTTAMSGALVAGLDAGLIYNEFPYMGLGLTPPKSELFSDFYSHVPDKSDIWWRNPLENPSLVQLDHRILATTTFTAIVALFTWTKTSKNLQQILPRAAKKGVHGVLGFACLQVLLGISTLIYMVPLPLASAHQAGALALLTWTAVLGRRVAFPKQAAALLNRRAQVVATTTTTTSHVATSSPISTVSAGASKQQIRKFHHGVQRMMMS